MTVVQANDENQPAKKLRRLAAELGENLPAETVIAKWVARSLGALRAALGPNHHWVERFEGLTRDLHLPDAQLMESWDLKEYEDKLRDAAATLEGAAEELEQLEASTGERTVVASALKTASGRNGVADRRSIFVIHGRNTRARDEMGRFLRACGLTPINFSDLRSQLGGTPTIAEIVTEGMNRAHGIVALFTPDESAALRPELRSPSDKAEDKQRWQARPNVIFEAGMAFARDPTRVVFVLLGDPSLFTDVSGVHLLRPTNDPGGDRLTLRDTLRRSMGCEVEDSRDWMKSGDFESCVGDPPAILDPFAAATFVAPSTGKDARVVHEPAMPSPFESLRATVDALQPGDYTAVKKLRNQLELHIHRTFPPAEAKRYVEKLHDVHFAAQIGVLVTGQRSRGPDVPRWNRGKQEMKDLIDLLIEAARLIVGSGKSA